MLTNKKVRIKETTPENEFLFSKDRVHIVYGEKRDEYLIVLTDGSFQFIWKGNCEEIEKDGVK